MSKTYKIGYGKPPAETRFKPGQSGNPAGRKKGSQNLATMVQRALDETVTVKIAGRSRKISKLEAAFTQQANKAAGGDAKAIKLMLDVLAAAQMRDAGQGGADQVDLEARRKRDQRILDVLKARVDGDGGDDGSAR